MLKIIITQDQDIAYHNMNAFRALQSWISGNQSHKLFLALNDKLQELQYLTKNYPKVTESSAKKYVDNYWVYVAEKMHAIEHAQIKANSKCLDISTGIGVLPFMLNNLGHTCDATDVATDKDDIDPDVVKNGLNQQDAFDVLRSVHKVSINHLTIKPNEYITLPKKYDCIFSMRVVWDGNFSFDDGSYPFFINNMLDYTDKLVISWNMDTKDAIPFCIRPYVVDNQFNYGTLTIHTEKINVDTSTL